jgi:fumarylacetoacetate (FAA) hydrolase
MARLFGLLENTGTKTMKLGSLKGGLDGRLIVVSRSLDRFVSAAEVAPSLQAALDDWEAAAPQLEIIYRALEAGQRSDAEVLDFSTLASPLPRAYEFLDGSAYLPHVERVRRARGAEVPESFYTDPLMYQATSAGFMGPRDPVPVVSEDHGIDFESEIVVVTGDVPMAATPAVAAQQILLVGLVNDVSLRNLIPAELAKGFGFLQSKPRSALSPVLVTPDELGDAWRDSVLHLCLHSYLNGEWFGSPDAGENMQFSFAELVAHAARTRPLAAGTIVGSGTIANEDTAVGASCLAEKRMLEIIADGKPETPFMSFGDRIRIEMLNEDDENIFGAIEQVMEQYEP